MSPTQPKLNLALCQIHVGRDKAANLSEAKNAVYDAAKKGMLYVNEAIFLCTSHFPTSNFEHKFLTFSLDLTITMLYHTHRPQKPS